MVSSGNESVASDDDTVNQKELLSKSRYMRVYENFIAWKNERGAKCLSEKLLLDYFKELAKSKRPNSLWCMYSMLKNTLIAHNGVNIKTYTNLRKYLKEFNDGYINNRTRSSVFSSTQVATFLKEAPDKEFLINKVMLIFGIQGACDRNDLINVRVNDIEKHSDQLLLVKLRRARGKMERTFIIRGEYKDIVDKYMALRPPDMPTKRFFVRYFQGRCTKQVIGKNRMSTMPLEMATYLNLPNPKQYTWYSFRRTAAALVASSSGLTKLGRRLHEEHVMREVDIADPSENDTATKSDTIYDDCLFIDDIKVEQSSNSPIPSDSAFSLPSVSESQDPVPSPPPQKTEHVHNLQSGRIKITESFNNTSDTKSTTVPTKNITILFENCTNVSHITFNF